MTIAAKGVDRLAIDTIRTLSIDAVQKANSGHPGAPMGAAPMAYVLWTRFLRHAPTDPDWPNRDRFVLSAGHALDAPLLAPPPDRLRPPARRAQGLPPVGLEDAGPSRVRPDSGRRGDDRTARPGLRERGRDGDRRASPGLRVQPAGPRDRRSLDLRDLLGRRPPGGDRLGGSVARRPPPPGQAGVPLRRQQDPARRTDLVGLVGGRPEALRGLRLARHPGRRWQRPRRDRARDRGSAGRRPAEPDRRPHAHRLRQPEPPGQPEGAWPAARSRRGAPDEAGLRLGPGPRVLRAGRGRGDLPGGRAGRREGRRRLGGRAGPLRRAPIRSWRPSSAAGSTARCAKAGTPG